MMIDSNYARSMAEQLATYEVQPALARVRRTEALYKSQLEAVNRLETALRTFRDAMRDRAANGSGIQVNTASFSHDGFASATVGSNATAGTYHFFVEQLASNHQIALQGLRDGDIDTHGTLDITVGGAGFSVDLTAADRDGDGQVSLAELSAAINEAADNSGIKATLVRSDGEVILMLSSEQDGAAGGIGLSVTGTDTADTRFENAVAAPVELSAARDARVRLGGESGLLLTHSRNTFDDLIDGISLTFTRAHASGDQPLTVEIKQDVSATRDNARAFIDAVNALFQSIDSLTVSGGENVQRGPLAGDASIRSIENMIGRVLRTSFDGMTLLDFGIVNGRDGRLTLDVARFEQAMAANPEGLDKLLSGKDKLLDTFDKNLQMYLGSTSGVLKTRKETISSILRQSDQQMTRIEDQYERHYARYLKQYNTMMQMLEGMQQTQGMFA